MHVRKVGLGAVMLLSIGPAVRPSAAQVGHDPRNSPYVDLRRSGGAVFLTGWIAGGRGDLKIGHSEGPTFTFGYEVAVSGALRFFPSVTYLRTNRYVINPFRDDSVRLSGPFDDDMLLLEAGLRFFLTGGKTWNGITTYIGGSVGMAVSEGSPPDSGSYKFGKKVALTPGVGLRFFPSRRFSVLLDGRVAAWRLLYPPDYFRVASSDGIPVLTSDDPDVEWTIHPWISIGLGWNF